jgi:hypothetical protein
MPSDLERYEYARARADTLPCATRCLVDLTLLRVMRAELADAAAPPTDARLLFSLVLIMDAVLVALLHLFRLTDARRRVV